MTRQARGVRVGDGLTPDARCARGVSGYRAHRDLFARTTAGVKFGLERTRALLDALGNPHQALRALHVAGTNGKGSIVRHARRGAACARACASASTRRRTWSTSASASLVDGAPMRERRSSTWRRAVDAGGRATRRHVLRGHDGDGLRRLRARAASTSRWSRSGLGGRLDSTNVVRPLVAGVTTIGLDHVEYLGDTLEEIAREKAGIFKRGRAGRRSASRDPAIRDLLVARRRARGRHADRVHRGRRPACEDVRADGDGTTFELRRDERRADRWHAAGRARTRRHNAAVALAMLDALPAPPAAPTRPRCASRCCARRALPGRFQRVGQLAVRRRAQSRRDRARSSQTLARRGARGPVAAVVCVLGDKDWRAMMRGARPVVDRSS